MDGLEIFLATVTKVYLTFDDFDLFEKDGESIMDDVIIYNNNKNFTDRDSRYLGAIKFERNGQYVNESINSKAYPFDKNNLTFPIEGETVFIILSNNEYYWLPYTKTQYPNFREDYKTTVPSIPSELDDSNTKSTDYNDVNSMGITNNKSNISETQKKKYIVKENIKFLKPYPGDTIIQGRVANTIRFSESFLTSNQKPEELSPSIIIRNRQSDDTSGKKIGELVEEDINKDGSSIYIVSNKVKIPYNHNTIKKEKRAFKDYPKDTDIKGDRIFLNSDQVLLASKAREFIIFGKGNTGVITDGRFSVDAAGDVEFSTNNNIIMQTGQNKKIFLDSQGGTIYLGSDIGQGNAGAAVQKMVLGGELVEILGQLIDAITQQVYATPCGPTTPGPENRIAFTTLKAQLNTLLSAKNFLSKT